MRPLGRLGGCQLRLMARGLSLRGTGVTSLGSVPGAEGWKRVWWL